MESNQALEIRDTTDGEDRLVILKTSGNVGIGMSFPDQKLSVAGTVESTSGGFKFPDGTIQATAAAGGGGNTLDAAYDQDGAGTGRTITADAGPVEILGPDGLTVAGSIRSGSSIIIDGSAGAEKIISTDALELHTSTGRILRLEPELDASGPVGNSPNIIAGWSGNAVTAGVAGATISGGGVDDDGASNPDPNRVTDDFGTVGGGRGNRAGDDEGTTGDATYATIGGGLGNEASATQATVGGGRFNLALAFNTTVGGGESNFATEDFATISGGGNNQATGEFTTVGGGLSNQAVGTAATVAGGDGNQATGTASTIPGGSSNVAQGTNSFAAGKRAKALHNGTFVWADSTDEDFASTVSNQFLIRAANGVVISQGLGDGLTLRTTSGSIGPSLFMISNNPSNQARISLSGSNGRLDLETVLGRITLTQAGDVGIGDSQPDAQLMVRSMGTTDILNLYDGNTKALTVKDGGDVGIGIGTTTPNGRLHVQANNGRVAKFDRFGSDGQIVAWARDDNVVGDVTVTGGVVSYNAFSGSHYAWCDETPQPGALMVLTGENRHLRGDETGEMIYGVTPSTEANDPACLGAYFSTTPHTDLDTTEDVRLVTALGNGDLWVIDRGMDISPGDLLMSSDVPGHAMLDNPAKFPIGYIVARAAEALRWSEAEIAADGVRRAKISVLFESFTRGSVAAVEAIKDQQEQITSLKNENEQLTARLSRIEAVLIEISEQVEGGAR